MTAILRQSIDNLRANKLRSFLTMFGIMWGVISVVILSAVGEGFQRGNQKVLEELGKNIVIIRNGRTSLQAGGERAGRIVRLTLSDAIALQQRSRLLEHVSPELMRGGVKVKSEFNSSSLQMSGIWPVFQTIRTLEVNRGRLLTGQDGREARRVVVIGHETSRLLFADRDPVGRAIALNGLAYTVVGRIRKKDQDSNYTGADNERMFVPYETMRKDFPLMGEFDSRDSLSAIIVAPFQHVADEMRQEFEDRSDVGLFAFIGHTRVEDEIRRILGPKLDFDPNDIEALSFWNTSLESILFSKMIDAMREFFISVSVITLALGGIGVMNIMLIAVKERTKEIGVRKALGATSSNVQWLFFSEGLFLTLASGVLGFALGYGLCALVNLAPMPARFSGMIVTWPTVAFAIVSLTVIGVAASTYPARRAAALPPVEALRFEV